jgi:hypothetical protein
MGELMGELMEVWVEDTPTCCPSFASGRKDMSRMTQSTVDGSLSLAGKGQL